MKRFRYIIWSVIILISARVYSQADCVLGVGVTNDSISAELKYRNDVLNNELQNVKERHPQSSETELRQLADKYKSVMDSMGRVQAMIDKRMLTLFNSKQYELYQSLCKQAYRSPYVVVPTVYTDSIVDKN